MGKLNNLKKKILTIEDFEHYPVWTWDDTNEYQVPIQEDNPSWDDYDNYFIKAKFKTNTYDFDGFLVGAKLFYAFGIFVKGQTFVLNLNMPDRVEVDLKKIFHLLNCQPFPFFPVHYESTVRFRENGIIKGMLILKEKKT
jgi:hypothetical protein